MDHLATPLDRGGPLSDYQIAYHHATSHGLLTAVHIPDSREPVPDAVMTRLLPEEQELARELGGYRQVQFVGGRLAMHQAMTQLRIPEGPVMPDERGAPVLPKGFAGSISHKRTVAVAMAARSTKGTLGVDIEDYGPPRLSIAPRVLTESELQAVSPLPDDRRWMEILLRFSLKESIYKALDPYVKRYVGFHEVEVWPDVTGRATAKFKLADGEGPFDAECRFEWIHRRLLTSVRIVRTATHPTSG